MFLVGGPAFSGTTLLTLLLNQGNLVCLDEPDFHNPTQSHRGIPFLQSLFPEKQFPPRPESALTYPEAVDLARACENAISPLTLGFKTCDQIFVDYAKIFKSQNLPVIAIVRDIRDALARPLPPWLTESALNRAYRLVWNHLNLCDLWLRYEELVADPAAVLARISRLLRQPLEPMASWTAEAVHDPMLKLDRHDLLKAGRISAERVGIGRSAGITLSHESRETARMMGY